MPQYGIVEYLYIVITGIIQGILDIWMISPYIKCKRNKGSVKYVLMVLLAIHDIFWGVLGETGNNAAFCIEIMIFYPAVFALLYFCYQGYAYWNFTYLFAVEWCYQMLASVISIPLLAVRFEGDIDAMVSYMNTVSVPLFVFTVTISFISAWIIKNVWSYFYKFRSRLFNALCILLTCLDIGVLIFYGWKALSVCFSVLVLLIMVFFLYQNRSEKNLEKQFAYYQGLEELQAQKEKEISIIRHDIANHLGVMKEMEREEAGRALLKKIDKNSRKFTDIRILDCLIYEKEKECLEMGIQFEKQGVFFRDTCISEYNLISLFANLLDNAMEAARQTKEPTIKMNITRQQGYLKIVIQNSKPEKSKPLKSEFRTTKSDKSKHGIGNRIIREIVSVYDGRVVYKDDGNLMTVCVMFGL